MPHGVTAATGGVCVCVPSVLPFGLRAGGGCSPLPLAGVKQKSHPFQTAALMTTVL